jgi:hypothetical protein
MEVSENMGIPKPSELLPVINGKTSIFGDTLICSIHKYNIRYGKP